MLLIKRLIKFVLNKFGVKISVLPQHVNDGDKYINSAILTNTERKEVSKLLRKYVDKSAHQPNQYKSYREAKAYLSNERMISQRTLVEYCKTAGLAFDGKRILDIGCGLGYLLRVFSQFGENQLLIGLDPSPKAMVCGPIMCPSAKFEQRLLTVDDKFNADIVVLTQVLEHLVEPKKMLKMLINNLAINGVMIITVPDGRHDTLSAGTYLADRGAYTGHINFWSIESFELFLRECFPACRVVVGSSSSAGIIALIFTENL